MATDQRQPNAGHSNGFRGSVVEHWRMLLGAAAAAVCLLLGGLVGFALGSSAGDPSRQVTGVVEVVNDHAISLTDVDGVEGGRIASAFVGDPALNIQDGDTVSGTYVE